MRQRAPLLLIVDLQVGLQSLEYGQRNNPSATANVARLLRRWRRARWPVIFTKHISSRSGSPLASEAPGRDIEPSLDPQPDERVFDKKTNSAFKAPAFADHLQDLSPIELVIAGVATDACVTATAREAKDLGYLVVVVADACATFERAGPENEVHPAELVHAVSLSALAASGIRVSSTVEQLARVER